MKLGHNQDNEFNNSIVNYINNCNAENEQLKDFYEWILSVILDSKILRDTH